LTATSHNALLVALRRHVDDPQAETIEYLKRDALNQALRNTDNHARNTAVQRTANGRIQLTPVFDFAPMYKDPDMVPRAVHWVDKQGRRTHAWSAILDAVAWVPGEREVVAHALKGFANTVSRLADTARDCGVEPTIIVDCQQAIDRVAEELARIETNPI
jgi:serine/threonine-protein kinase HipA